jgi:hypothetical protein
MPDTRTVKKIFNWKLLTKRSQGRPRYRWEDNIKQDICQMKIKNWIAYVSLRRPKLSTRKLSAWKKKKNIERAALRLRFHIGAATVSNESTFEAHCCRHSSKGAP